MAGANHVNRAGWCAVIPAYQEAASIAAVVSGVRARRIPVIVVDDGSHDGTADAAARAGAHVVKHDCNRGKGAALASGLARAREDGFAWAVTLDGDGQHDPADLASFVDAAARGEGDLICGNRMADPQGMPLLRRLTNRVMSRWISRAAGQSIPDTQCGFRAYRLACLAEVVCITAHFEWESEVLIRLSNRGARIASVPIRTIYRNERSKIRPLRDTVRFWRMWRLLRGARKKSCRGEAEPAPP